MDNRSEIYARYKAAVAVRCAPEYRQRVEEVIRRRGLSSAMNDTRWLELQAAIRAVPETFRPAYVCRLLPDEAEHTPYFGEAPTWVGAWEWFADDWEAAPPPFFSIEWMSIHPRQTIDRGKLIAPAIEDRSELLVEILRKSRIPYEEIQPHTFLIRGYR
ncbi:MAG: hypothetical protein K2G93_03340 [Rikenella sp.]|nr:hypothetical protein [Rikenella sp.]